MTYTELDRRVRAVAALLQDMKMPGERVLLLYPPGLDYIVAFFACLYAGMVAVPSYPPRLNRPDARLQAIAVDSGACVVLTTTSILAGIERRLLLAPELTSLVWHASDAVDTASLADAWRVPALAGDSLAFLQYTSGSTATPKGVMVSHANLLHNQAMIRAAFGHDEGSVVAGWLPIYHDMGLIGNVLQPLYLGGHCILMSPVTFIHNPILWLRAVSQYGAHSSGGPNFAYALCVQRTTPEQREGLDLSSWKVAFNGAEPVRYETLKVFATTFAPYGFRPEAFYPCYGLAEATLFVSGRSPERAPLYAAFRKTDLERGRAVPADTEDAGAQMLVGCGQRWPDEDLLIVDPETLTACPPGQVGEIWVAGSHVAQGYWEKPAETQRTFRACLADSGEGPFLRTGDLGFLQDGELFVTGRIKDLIIIRGRNYYPQDIEFTVAQSHPALQADGGAAFSVDVAGEERLVVVHELRREERHADVDGVAQAIRRAVAEEHALQVYTVVLLRPMSLPKTSSGKVQRRLCRTYFLEDRLKVIGSSILDTITQDAPDPVRVADGGAALRAALPALASEEERRALVERSVRELVAQVLRIPVAQVALDRSLVALGLDSLMAAELEYRVASELAATVVAPELLDGLSVADLANRVLAQSSAFEPDASMRPLEASSQMEFPLSFEQERLWFLDQVRPGDPAYHIPLALDIKGPLDVAALERSLAMLLQRHAILRATFPTRNGRPLQVIAPSQFFSLPPVDLRELPDLEREQAIRRYTAAGVASPFDLARGPLLRATLLRLAGDEHRLILVLHHIIADVASLGVLLDELSVLYRAASSGIDAPLPPLPIQYGDFVRWQRAGFDASPPSCEYWKAHLAGAPATLNLPPASEEPAPSRQAQRFFEIPAPLAASLRALSRDEDVTLFVTLLAAFEALLCRYTEQEDWVVGVPTGGRVRPELRSLIGFFAYPLALRSDLSGDPAFRELLARLRRVTLDGYAHRAVPFSRVVQALRPARAEARAPLFQVMFSLARSPLEGVSIPGLALSLADVEGATDFALFLTLLEEGEVLRGMLAYDPDRFDAATVDALATLYVDFLARCVQQPEVRLSQLILPAEMLTHLPRTLAITATFTAEPLRDALAFWMERLDIPARIVFAPFHQVFQQLLDPQSLLARNERGSNIVLVRFEDWLRSGSGDLERNVADLIAALRGATVRRAADGRAPLSHWVCVCPPSPTGASDAGLAALFDRMEARLVSELEDAGDVYVVTSAELAERYPVADYADPHADALGHIPYTPAFFTALGTLLARKLHVLEHPPYKVIVLDCDGTLWRGVCGEDGPLGVAVGPPYAALQDFMLRQDRDGMLLCLCSKNTESDVRAVFEQNPGMRLKWDHLAAWRINWEPKSQNLRALAGELRLGLDSFIFLDDSPVECAGVRAACPEVLALQLPEAERIPRFLENVWAFDRLKVTEMDRRRAAFYRQDQARRRVQQEAPSLEDFLAGLELEIEIAPLAEQHLPRAAQLTQRTNQFNCAPQRRTEGELRALCLNGVLEGCVVHVRDRFGDYGLVGLMLFFDGAPALTVDTFLLSCRALGRGVERRMLAYLAGTAADRGLAHVDVRFRATDRNQPAYDFLERSGLVAGGVSGDGDCFRLVLE